MWYSPNVHKVHKYGICSKYDELPKEKHELLWKIIFSEVEKYEVYLKKLMRGYK